MAAGVGESPDSASRTLPLLLVNSRIFLGVRDGPRPYATCELPILLLRSSVSAPLDLGGRRSRWS